MAPRGKNDESLAPLFGLLGGDTDVIDRYGGRDMIAAYRPWGRGLALVCALFVLLALGGDEARPQEKLPPPRPGEPAKPDGGEAKPEEKELPKASAGYADYKYTPPGVLPDEKPLPINLALSLKLAGAQAWDILIAAERIRIALADLEHARVLALPTIVGGVDYQHHDGQIENTDGTQTRSTRNALYVGGAPEAVFSIADAIFEPLAARQILEARKAGLQAATNDTIERVARAYFTAQEARADLSGAIDIVRRTVAVLDRVESLAPELVPHVEVSRTRAQLAHFQEIEDSARERWYVASADLVRIVRLDPSVIVMPQEPPELKVTLVAPEMKVDELLLIALMSRPELVEFRALAQSALQRWREERWRPLVPSIYARGSGSQLPDAFAFGSFAASNNGSLRHFGGRDDWDVQVCWELRNLGLGNHAAMKATRSQYEISKMEVFRTQDIVGQEVAEAYAHVRSAANRVSKAEVELREAVQSANENYDGLGQVKRVGGNIRILVIRPQEVVAAEQALVQAYYSYYGAVGDYNRAQFQLYRALGNPAQALSAEGSPVAPPPCDGTPEPAPMAAPKP
jgi:outer membrane protein TolC